MNKKKSDKCTPNEYYVKRISETVDKTLADYPRVMAVRFDLRFPDEEDRVDCPTRYYDAPDVISNFIASVKSQIEEDIKRKRKAGKTTLTCKVRFVWVRELNQDETKHHYHVLLLLNKDAYPWPGKIQTEPMFNFYSIYQIVINAWIRAIKRDDHEKNHHGLIHLPIRGFYSLNRNKPHFETDCKALTQRAMYLAKEFSKDHSDSRRNLGCSQG
jgi:hypothetical protein